MGEARKDALRVSFDNKLKLEFHGARITSAGELPGLPERPRQDETDAFSALFLERRDLTCFFEHFAQGNRGFLRGHGRGIDHHFRLVRGFVRVVNAREALNSTSIQIALSVDPHFAVVIDASFK